MDFIEFSQLLFDRQLLASQGTVHAVLNKYDLAMKHGHQFVGLMKRDKLPITALTSRIYKGTDDSLIGILPVKGALVYEETGWEALCGMTSYEGLQNRAEYMIKEKKINHLILELNSGGGMAYGCFEAAQYVRNLARENGVKITSYVDGVAHSGAYAWCCIADEVIVNPMAKVGSIGVVLPLVNTSERDKKEGIQRIYMTAGKSKVPFDKDGNYTKEALDDIQKDIMVTYDMFTSHVAEMRGMDKEAVINTEAKTFGTEEALKIGLVDQVMTKEQFYQHLGNFNGDMTMTVTAKDKQPEIKDDEQSPVITQLSTQVATQGTKITELETQITEITTERDKYKTDFTQAESRIKDLEQQVKNLEEGNAKIKQDSRRERIAALVADDQVEEEVEFVADFSDEKFDKYITRLTTQNEKIQEKFKPVGVDTEEDENNQNLSVEDKIVQRVRAKTGKA